MKLKLSKNGDTVLRWVAAIAIMFIGWGMLMPELLSSGSDIAVGFGWMMLLAIPVFAVIAVRSEWFVSEK